MRNLILHWRRLRNVEELSIHGVKVSTAQDEIPRSIRTPLFKGTYELEECRLVERSVRRGERVLEIGTGIGLVGLVATRLSGEGNVCACEANPALEHLIRKNYRLNGWRPNLVMRAVTSDGRDIEFFVASNFLSSSAIDRGLSNAPIIARSLPINTLIGEHRPSVIIMDVEGGEVELLPVADLSRVHTIVVEMHPHIVGQRSVQELIAGIIEKKFRTEAVQGTAYLFTR